MQKITTCLWFDDQAEEAMNFYVSIFKNSKVLSVMRWPEGHADEGKVLVTTFELDGVPFQALNGGPQFKFNEAMSQSIDCKTQEEVDYFWDKLIEGGGEPSQCSWLKDKFGVSWQVVPEQLPTPASGSGPGQGRPGDVGDDADEQDRHRQDRRGGEGVRSAILPSPLWEKVDRRAAPRRMRGVPGSADAWRSSWNTPHPSPSATPSPTGGEGKRRLTPPCRGPDSP